MHTASTMLTSLGIGLVVVGALGAIWLFLERKRRAEERAEAAQQVQENPIPYRRDAQAEKKYTCPKCGEALVEDVRGFWYCPWEKAVSDALRREPTPAPKPTALPAVLREQFRPEEWQRLELVKGEVPPPFEQAYMALGSREWAEKFVRGIKERRGEL
jgi:hypothetical protein